MDIKCGCVFLELANKSDNDNSYLWEDKLYLPLNLDDILNLTYSLDLGTTFSLSNTKCCTDLNVSDSSLSLITTNKGYVFTLTPQLIKDLSHSLKQAKLITHGWV